jgi:hypothetical protein
VLGEQSHLKKVVAGRAVAVTVPQSVPGLVRTVAPAVPAAPAPAPTPVAPPAVADAEQVAFAR